MNEIFTKWMILLAFFAIISCSEDNPIDPSKVDDGKINVSVNGINNSFNVTLNSFIDRKIIVEAERNVDDKTIEKINVMILLPKPTPEKTKGFCSGQFMVQTTQNGKIEQSIWRNDRSNYEITEVNDTNIKGKFDFVGTNKIDSTTKEIKGAFNIKR